MIFALDATASREPTWDQARRLHGELFSAALHNQTLAIQLCYYRGLSEFNASHWADAARSTARSNEQRQLPTRSNAKLGPRHPPRS